jgi:hypothetical protein
MTKNTGTAARYTMRRNYVLANWEARSDVEMADFLKISEPQVAGIRKRLNLWRGHRYGGSAEASQMRAEITPPKPRGYTREQIAWAKENADDPEARMMLVHHADRPRMAGE